MVDLLALSRAISETRNATLTTQFQLSGSSRPFFTYQQSTNNRKKHIRLKEDDACRELEQKRPPETAPTYRRECNLGIGRQVHQTAIIQLLCVSDLSFTMQRLKRFLLKRYSRLDHELSAPEPAPTNPPTSPETNTGSSCHGSINLSRIERLPFEIRNEILLAVDSIADISSLVHASPTFHQQYRLDRAFWLWHCLKQELGNVLIDAYNVDTYNTPEFRSTRTRQRVLLYVEDYKLQRSEGTESLSQPPEDDVIRIASFHTSVIRTFMQQYATWTRASLEGLSEPKDLSRTEARRIVRGLYRFQMFCSLFGPARGGGNFFYDDGLLEAEERLQLLLDVYEAWEIEEILCINVFVHAKYRVLFEQVEWDLHPDNPSFDDVRTGPHTPPGAFHLASNSRTQIRI